MYRRKNSICSFCAFLILSTILSKTTGQSTTTAQNPLDNETAAARWEWKEYCIIITIILFLITTVLIKIAFRKIPYVADYVPESLVLIIVGIIFGAIVKYGVNSGHTVNSVWILKPTLFFNYLLPPIVLESAYSLYNRTFSEYLGVVLIFAVLGTIFNFLIIGFVMFGLFKAGAMGPPTLHFDLKGFLLFSSLIVAVDPVAVLAIFQDIGVELSLYYIVFGESLLNDAITVVLYDIMSAFAGKDNVSGHEIGVGIASFFTVSFGGFLIGVVVGIISCLLTRIKSHLAPFIVLLLAYFSYILTDCVGWSGIIGMIGCGLMQAAYAFHNLDHKSVTMVHQLTKIVAEVCESVIFLYLGIEVVRENLYWHTGFMLWSLVLCLVARALVVLVITAIVNAAHLDGTKISFTEQAILIYGGLRGAVAFSLAVLVEERHFTFHGAYNRRLIITNTLFIILFTVGFMGMTMKPLVKWLKIRMQANEPLSLFGVLNKSLMDELMTGLEVVANVKGRNRVRDLFMRLDEKYFRRWFMRDPETYDEKLIKVYEKIALKLHNAQMQPHVRESMLSDLPRGLRQRYLVAEAEGWLQKSSWSDFSLNDSEQHDRDLEVSGHVLNCGPEFGLCMRSSHQANLLPNDKRQVDFSDTLEKMMCARLMSQSNTLPGFNLGCSYAPHHQHFQASVTNVDNIAQDEDEQST
ncbi:Sodium/hydrogen exchanger [Fasciolopsis buskii]|uniref:Sodium/hydrogen exchanger n=1 Tax=Fasciolopsis buskii TaxID=27845 RepID=A0A8E0RTJ4_9TREM|nr:Sodium/hydrogen exchanger [Fasciolopsis buski]